MANKLLLTVGINDYPGTNADLRGCVNDSNDVLDALTARGYKGTQLLDAQASKPAFAGILEGMVTSLKWGDRLVVHISSHGTNIADRDGDEADGRDEAIVLHDYRTGGLFTDDEMHAVLSRKARGSRVLLLMDLCHSGTMQRFAPTPDLERTVDRQARPRFLDVDQVLGRSSKPAPQLPRGTSRAIAGVNLVSGCDDPEFSYDASFGGRANGAFTYYALAALRDNPRHLQAWYTAIRAALPSDRYPQTPQLQVASTWQKYTAAL